MNKDDNDWIWITMIEYLTRSILTKKDETSKIRPIVSITHAKTVQTKDSVWSMSRDSWLIMLTMRIAQVHILIHLRFSSSICTALSISHKAYLEVLKVFATSNKKFFSLVRGLFGGSFTIIYSSSWLILWPIPLSSSFLRLFSWKIWESFKREVCFLLIFYSEPWFVDFLCS
jgi:hypothetical protein